MAYLFDTDAIAEALKSQPLPPYLDWLRTIPREDQFISAISLNELFAGTFQLPLFERHLKQIQNRLLPAITVLPYDFAVAREYGRIRTRLEDEEISFPDGDIQVAATAIYHGLALVTGDISHFRRIRGLRLEPVLDRIRRSELHI